jgi:hypothetical protein
MSELKTCFKRVDYDLAGLLHYLDIGDIGFPRAWLERAGEKDLKIINQMANYALLEWPENISISDDPPSKYVGEIRGRFAASDWKVMHEMHALPDAWESMPYDAFLRARRGLMASVIRKGFETLQ